MLYVPPLLGEPAAASCPVCQSLFAPRTKQRSCSKTCLDTAWRRRHQRPPAVVAIPRARPRADFTFTVYEWEGCGTRSWDRSCEDCGSFMLRVGSGGQCDEPVTVEELLVEEVTVTTIR